MDPFFVTDSYFEDFRRARMASAAGFQFGTPSSAVVMIERVAGGLRRLAAAIECWAAGAGDADRPRSLSTH